MADEYREKAALSVVAPKISGACRTMSAFWRMILKPKCRMTTPSMLISQSPAPHAPAVCVVARLSQPCISGSFLELERLLAHELAAKVEVDHAQHAHQPVTCAPRPRSLQHHTPQSALHVQDLAGLWTQAA